MEFLIVLYIGFGIYIMVYDFNLSDFYEKRIRPLVEK